MINVQRSDRLWAVVPLKSPELAKSRLADCLSPPQRRRLLFELATRMIRALQATAEVETVVVVTASREVADFARALGATPILQTDETGTAAAFAAAIARLRPKKLQRLLMIAGDLPLVSPAALQRLCVPTPDADVIIVPDRHRLGTNALLCAPPQALAPCFGHDSFRRHLAAAEAAKLRARILDADALSLDLDDANDLDELRRRDRDLTGAMLSASSEFVSPAVSSDIRAGAAVATR